MPKIVAIVLAISGDLCRDCIRLHCSAAFDVYDYFRFNVFFQMRQVFESTGKCDATQRMFTLFFCIASTAWYACVFFFLLCFIIGDREFLTGGPAALRHTCCLLGRRMFFLLFFFAFLSIMV